MPCSSAGLSSRREAAAESSAWTAGPRISFGRSWIYVVGVETDLIVDLPLLGIAEHVVRFRDRLELLLRRFISGVDVRVILPRQLAKSFADVLGGGGFLYAQQLVIIFFGRRCHSLSEQASVHNFSLFLVFHYHFHVLEFGRVFVDRNGSGAARRIDEDQPLPRIFGEIQKICLIIHLEIQFNSQKGATDYSEFDRFNPR